MKKFKIRNIEKWLHQNDAEIVDIKEGCLIDNLLAYSNKAVIALIETFVNCNASEYIAFYAKTGTPEAIEVENRFYSIEEA